MPIFYGGPYQGPCVVSVNSSSNSPSKYYGPFPSINESKTWMNIQFSEGFTGSFSVIPLMTPFRSRTYDDWWMSDTNRSSESIQLDYPSKPWFKLSNWKKWLRKSSKVYYKSYINKPINFDDLPIDIKFNYYFEALKQIESDSQYEDLYYQYYESLHNVQFPPQAYELAKTNYEQDVSFK